MSSLNKISFFDFHRLHSRFEKDLEKAISRVFQSGWYILGPETKALESELSDYLSEGVGHFVTCNSGTDALILSLKAAGIEIGDEVLTVSHTAVPTISAIASIGAVPKFVEVDPDTWLMDLTKLASCITERTRAIIPVHLYGNLVSIPALRAILESIDRKDIAIIEDCAQSFGSYEKNKASGTQGDFGAFSFYPTKNLGALGDGGGVWVRSQELAEKLRMLRNYGQETRYHARIPRGINSRLDEIQAAIVRARFGKFASECQHKEQLVKLYREGLKNLPLRFQKITEETNPCWHLWVVQFQNKELRDRAASFLKESQIETIIHYPIPNHKQPAFSEFREAALPVTESLTDTILSLPMNPYVEISEVDRVIGALTQFFRTRS